MPSKSESDVLKSIKELQFSALRDMKTSATLLEKEVDRLLKKIDSVGINGYYSINSDAMRYTTSLWQSSLRLGELKRFEDKMLSEIKKQRKERLSSSKKTCK